MRRGFGFTGFGFSSTVGLANSAAPPVQIASWPALIGAEMMVNGDCGSQTGWFLPAGSAIALGKMTLTAFGDQIENDGISSAQLIIGATYRTAFTIDTVSLGSVFWAAGLDGAPRSTVATFSQDIVADSDSAFFEGVSATMQLDNFSVKSVGLMGIEANWSFVGFQIVWVVDGPPPGMLSFGEAAQADIASLTGSAATAFDAAVSASTATTVSVYVPAYSAGDLSVRLRGGSWVALNISATGWSTPVAVTSGSGNGFDLRGNAGGTAELSIAAVDIDLAP